MAAELLDPAALPLGSDESPARLRILLAGLKLFGSNGFNGTSIRDVAAGAGMQSASLYSYFASKEAILTELVFIGHDAHHQILLSALLDSGPGPRAQLRSLIAAHVSAHCRFSDLAMVSNYERHHLSAESFAPARALRERSVQLLVEVVGRGTAQKVFNIIDPPVTLGALGALALSALSWFRDNGGVRTPDEVGASYAELALRIVGGEADG